MFKAIMAENLPNLGREMDIQFYEVQSIPNSLNVNRTTIKYIIIVKSQRPRKNFESSKRKRSNIKGTPIRQLAHSSTKTF